MNKKIKKFFRITLSGIGWTVLYAYIVGIIMKYFWHFDIFNPRYWRIIDRFWQNGGVIDTASEYMFILTLMLIIPLWILGWKKANGLSYVKIIFFPVFWYNDYVRRKYADATQSCIVIKNMGATKNKKQTPQQMMEEMIAERMPKAKDKKDLNSSKIRSNFEQKNRSFHEKMDSSGEQ
jgi:hypothetical protein